MLRLSSNSSERYLETLSAMGHPQRNADGWTAAQLPQQLGSGWMRHLELQRGFEVAVFEYRFWEREHFEIAIDEPGFNFACILNGDLPWEFLDGRCQSSGNGATLWAGLGTERFRTRACQPVRFVTVTASAEFLRGKTQTCGAAMSGFVESFLRRPETRSNIFRRSVAATTMYAAQRLLSLAPSDPLDRLRIESIALTILCDRLEALSPKALRPAFPSVRRTGLEKLHEVGRILAESPERSPSLGELARLVGMNECSLKSGFRQTFGVTVYGFLREQRMLLADELLMDGGLQVAQVAERVGYESPSRFAVSYRKRFGISPKQRQMGVAVRAPSGV